MGHGTFTTSLAKRKRPLAAPMVNELSTSGAGNVAPSQFLKEGLVTRGNARQVALVAVGKNGSVALEKCLRHILGTLPRREMLAGNIW